MAKEGVGGSQTKLPCRGKTARFGQRPDDPAQFRRREIGIERQPRARQRHLLGAVCAQARGDIGGAFVLPDDDRAHWFAGAPVPGKATLTLVGKSGRAVSPDAQIEAGRDIVQQFGGVVFHPARAGIDLAMLESTQNLGPARLVHKDGAGAGRALIDRQNAHGYPVSRTTSTLPDRGGRGKGRNRRRSGKALTLRPAIS